MTSALEQPIRTTIFPDLAATDRQSAYISLTEFAEQLLATRAPTKQELPLFSCAAYGSKRTSKRALRHDTNLRELFAVVGDYDGEKITFDAAAEALRQANIAALLVTTPGHTLERPRWRAICPLSSPLHYERANSTGFQLAEYHKLVSRLAGIFSENLAPESWTRSQGWYAGGLEGSTTHQVLTLEGDCIDTRPDLDATGRPKPTPPVKLKARRGALARRATPIPGTQDELPFAAGAETEIPDEAMALDVAGALEAIGQGQGGHAALVSLAGKLAAQGLAQDTSVALLTYVADQRPPERRDDGWRKLRSDIPRTVQWAADKTAAEIMPGLASASQGAAHAPGANGTTPPPPGAPPNSSSPGGPSGAPGPGSTAYARALLRNRNPKFAGNLANCVTCLLERPELAGCVAFDEMAMGVVLRQALPGHPAQPAPRPWTDNDTSRLQDFLQHDCHMARVGKEVVGQGVEHVARMFGFHPVRDYLSGLTWDGTKRIDTWLTTYLGVDDSPYARTTARMWLVGLAARIFKPGCKFDYMLILEGLQGTLKSQVCVALCGPWVSDQSLDIRHDARAASQHLRNKWLIEVSELAFFRQADVETLKAFVTRTYERYLPRFARHEVIEPRQCGFVGTTNQETYLHDPTGNRRFWPHRTGKIRVRALLRDRNQLWAEVVAAYRAGEHWWPEETFERDVIQPEQAARYDADGWLEPMSTALDQLCKPKQAMRARGEREANGAVPRARTTLLQIWQTAMNAVVPAYGAEATALRFDRSAQLRTREILQFLGWRRGKLLDGRAQWEEPL